MKRNRKMLLCVTTTSMAAVIVGCATAQPVGTVANPHDVGTVARPVDDSPTVVDAAVGPDAGSAQAKPTEDEPDRPVGIVAHPPDHKK